jgi:hypothetical protein
VRQRGPVLALLAFAGQVPGQTITRHFLCSQLVQILMLGFVNSTQPTRTHLFPKPKAVSMACYHT